MWLLLVKPAYFSNSFTNTGKFITDTQKSMMHWARLSNEKLFDLFYSGMHSQGNYQWRDIAEKIDKLEF
jgi:hypothetical protein